MKIHVCNTLCAAILVYTGLANSADPQQEPLLQQSDLVYVGAFALPTDTMGTSRFGYGGLAITPYTDPSGRHTLFMCGHAQNPGQVAQVEIPDSFSTSRDYDSLPQATFLQGFADISDGDMLQKAQITTPDGGSIYGLLAYHGKLIAAVAEYYGCTQQTSHGISSLDLSLTRDFKGYFAIQADAIPRALGGPMTPVPTEWQTLLGGPVLTGNWALPIVSCTSAGPAATSFDPDQLDTTPTPGSTLLYYPLAHPLCADTNCLGAEATTSDLYNLTSSYGGMAFPAGFRSVLFFGVQGTGTYCYGTATDCNDPIFVDAKGPHAYPYRYQVWAYDADDLLAVKAGTKKSYEPRPYATWVMPELDYLRGAGAASIRGAGYDPETRRWYVTIDYGEQPRVDVYEIKTTTALRSGGAGVGTQGLTIRRQGRIFSLSLAGMRLQSSAQYPVRYTIFDHQGRTLRKLHSTASDGSVSWNAAHVAQGLYWVMAEFAGHVFTQSVFILSRG